MSAAGTKGVGGNEDEISEYLRRSVDAVVLPEKLMQYGSTYPPLILDGASGTGKTQQAFALVKAHKWIIYFLMSEPPKGIGVTDQPVYQKMRSLTKDEDDFRFARRVDKALEALRENEEDIDVDICSVDFLKIRTNRVGNETIDCRDGLWARHAKRKLYWFRKWGRKGLDLLMDVVLWMCSQRLQYENGSLDPVPIDVGGKTSCKFEDICRQLKDAILFVDEALPKSDISADGRPDAGAIERLRFVRNLGRTLKMRVVLAGTAATAANMIAVRATGNPSSRTFAGELAWIECQFLWKPMSENDVKRVLWPNDPLPSRLQRAVISALAMGRPYLVHLFGRVMKLKRFQGWTINFGRVMKLKRFQGWTINAEYLLAVLEEVGNELAIEKCMSDASNLTYLTAVWLHLEHVAACGFRLQPAELVRGHYFEPCVVVDAAKNPACGLLIEKKSMTPGHLRVKIYCNKARKAKKIMWNVSMTGTKEGHRAAFCWDFSGIEYALTACVQQCLAREPLLAVAISTQCGMDKAKFRNALSMLYQEAPQHLTVDAADGELNEQVVFALLQLASNREKLSKAKTRVDLDTFLRTIAYYMTNDSDELFADGVVEFCAKLVDYGEPGPSKVGLDALLGPRDNEFTIDDHTEGNYKTCIMPWLVPACSLEALKITFAEASSLFDDTNIAGLVPGVRNATFDALAYSWKKLSESKDVVELPEWAFEFKVRSPPDYKIRRAFKDLNEKCVSQQKKFDKKKRRLAIDKADKVQDHEPDGKTDKLECHAILITVTGGHENFCEIVYSDKNQKFLRIAMVVGLGRKLLK